MDIKSKTALEVKTICRIMTLALGLVLFHRELRGDDLPEEGAPLENIDNSGEVLPGEPEGIQARTYGVSVLARSGSGRVYLLGDLAQGKPDIGRILLLKRGKEFAMGMRVIKQYPAKNQFATKRVRVYKDAFLLPYGEKLRAIEKMGAVSQIPLTPQDNQDLQEVEQLQENLPPVETVAPVTPPGDEIPMDGEQQITPEEDVSNSLESSPQPLPEENAEGAAADTEDLSENLPIEGAEGELPLEGAENSGDLAQNLDGDVDGAKLESESDEGSSVSRLSRKDLEISAEETPSLDNYKNWFSVEMNALAVALYSGSIGFNPALGLRYGYTMKQMLFLKEATVQDSLVAEGGIFFYKMLNYSPVSDVGLSTPQDAYTVTPLSGTLRYNLMFGPDLTLFGYAGILQNFVLSAARATQTGIRNLNQTYLAFGGGLLINIGPNWTARADVGIDRLGLGLVLRF